jgi:type VI secretion system secreted protein VgrG
LAFSGPIPDQSNVEDTAITPLNISGYWSGGATPLVYSVFSGTLPVGLSLDSSTGIISGTPTTPN